MKGIAIPIAGAALALAACGTTETVTVHSAGSSSAPPAAEAATPSPACGVIWKAKSTPQLNAYSAQQKTVLTAFGPIVTAVETGNTPSTADENQAAADLGALAGDAEIVKNDAPPACMGVSLEWATIGNDFLNTASAYTLALGALTEGNSANASAYFNIATQDTNQATDAVNALAAAGA